MSSSRSEEELDQFFGGHVSGYLGLPTPTQLRGEVLRGRLIVCFFEDDQELLQSTEEYRQRYAKQQLCSPLAISLVVLKNSGLSHLEDSFAYLGCRNLLNLSDHPEFYEQFLEFLGSVGSYKGSHPGENRDGGSFPAGTQGEGEKEDKTGVSGYLFFENPEERQTFYSSLERLHHYLATLQKLVIFPESWEAPLVFEEVDCLRPSSLQVWCKREYRSWFSKYGFQTEAFLFVGFPSSSLRPDLEPSINPEAGSFFPLRFLKLACSLQPSSSSSPPSSPFNVWERKLLDSFQLALSGTKGEEPSDLEGQARLASARWLLAHHLEWDVVVLEDEMIFELGLPLDGHDSELVGGAIGKGTIFPLEGNLTRPSALLLNLRNCQGKPYYLWRKYVASSMFFHGIPSGVRGSADQRVIRQSRDIWLQALANLRREQRQNLDQLRSLFPDLPSPCPEKDAGEVHALPLDFFIPPGDGINPREIMGISDLWVEACRQLGPVTPSYVNPNLSESFIEDQQVPLFLLYPRQQKLGLSFESLGELGKAEGNHPLEPDSFENRLFSCLVLRSPPEGAVNLPLLILEPEETSSSTHFEWGLAQYHKVLTTTFTNLRYCHLFRLGYLGLPAEAIRKFEPGRPLAFLSLPNRNLDTLGFLRGLLASFTYSYLGLHLVVSYPSSPLLEEMFEVLSLLLRIWKKMAADPTRLWVFLELEALPRTLLDTWGNLFGQLGKFPFFIKNKKMGF